MPHRNNISIKAKFALLLTIVLWASAFVGIRAGLKGYSPGSLALLRFSIASICMLFVYWRTPSRHKVTMHKKDLALLILVVGMMGLGIYNITLNYGELTIPSGIASFIISQSPILTVIFAVFFLGERINIFVIIGMVVSLLGVMLISIGQTKGFKLDIGMLYVLIATLISALYSVVQKPFLRKYHAIPVTALIIWGATLILLIYLPDLYREIFIAPLSATLAVVYLGIFPAAVAYGAWNYALAEIPASRAASFLFFMPIIATFLGWVCLGEVPALISLVGGCIALLGVWIVNWAFRV